MTWRTRSNLGPSSETSSQSFEAVVLPNLDAAYSLARWLVRDPHLAEDVVQDAVVRGLSYFASFRGGDGRAWLMRIVRNAAYTALAARQRSSMRLEAPHETEAVLNVPDPGESPEDALFRQEDSARLERALAALPAELRECVVLKELEELSYKEIAQVTGVPIGTVMSRLWRARQVLSGSARDGGDHES